MATASSHRAGTADTDAIRRQMAQIRRELHEDMQNVVAGAEAATDWRRYVKLHPWASVGVAFALGFLIVPRRRRSITETAEKAAEQTVSRVQEAIAAPPPPRKKEKRSGLVGMLFGMAMPVAVRAAQSYAAHFVEQWIAQQQGGPAEPEPAAGTPDRSGRPGPPPGRP